MMVLYLTRFVGLRILVVCLCLLTLGVGIDLIKTTPALLEFGGAGAVAKYAALRVPALLATTLPIATLIGALISLIALGQNSELAVMRGAGISTMRIFFWLGPLAAALGAIHYLTVDHGVVWSNNALGASFGEIADVDVPKLGRVIAVRDEDRILYGRLASLDGKELVPFMSFTLDAEGNISERLIAERAEYVDGIWMLNTVERLAVNVEKDDLPPLAQLELDTAVTPQLVLDLASKTKLVDSRHAAAVLAKEAIATRGSAYYAMQIERSRVAWVIPLIMLLIGMLGSYKLPRSLSGLRAAGIGFLIGIFYVGFDGFFTSLGRLGAIPVQFAAYLPSIGFSLIAIAALIYSES